MKPSFAKRCMIVAVAALLLQPMVALAEEQVQPPATATMAPASTSPVTPAVAAETPAAQPVEPVVSQPPAAVDAPALPDQARKPDPQLSPALQLSPPITRIGVIDLARIDRESKQGKAAQAKVKAKKDKLQAQLTARQKQLEKQKAEIEAQLPTLSPAERAKKAKEFEKKVDGYRTLLEKAEKDMKPLVEELSRALSRTIKEAAAAYATANGLAAIISSRELVYVGSSVFPEDVTDGLLRQLNSSETKP